MPKKWKILLVVFFSVVVLLVALVAFLRMQTKKASPVDTITFTEQGLNLTAVYCQPSKKGRLIFGKEEDSALQPFGFYWRMGANEATTLELGSDISFAGEPLEAGKYSIYAVPGQDSWKIGVNSEAKRWGFAEPDYSNDVLNVMVPVTYSDEVVEKFTMTFEPAANGAELVLRWDTSVIRISIN